MFSLCFALVQFGLQPLQSTLIGPVLIGNLLYLPHGVRVLSAFFFGVRSILPLTVAETVCVLALGNWGVDTSIIILGAVMGGVSCWFVLEAFRMSGFNLYVDDMRTVPSWRSIILISAVGSVVNALGRTIAYREFFQFRDDLAQMLSFLIGDIGGTVFLLGALMLIFRWLRGFEA